MDAKGKEVTNTLEADNTSAAVARIRELGFFPTSVTEVGAKAKKEKAPSAPAPGRPAPAGAKKGLLKMQVGGGKVKGKQLASTTRQLATLIEAGLPLLRGLNVLRKQEKNPTLNRTLGALADAIESGSTFSEALAQHPKIFSKLYINMVRAGEVGGVLEVVLARLAEFQEKAERIKSKVVSAMVYPCIVLVMAVSMLFLLMIVIVPKFKGIFTDLLPGEDLPLLTQFVSRTSELMTGNILYILGGMVALFILLRVVIKTDKGRFSIDVFKLKMPVFGDLFRKTAISRFSRTLGTLISSGVPILQALNIVRETAGNAVIARAVRQVHDSVKEGESIAQPLAASRVFPPIVISMIEVGEETGELSDMLMKIADTYDDEVDTAVATLTSTLEPIMLVFLAAIVGTIVVSLFLPIITIIKKLGEGGGQ
jgi:type IV pilus assembly protein PilC